MSRQLTASPAARIAAFTFLFVASALGATAQEPRGAAVSAADQGPAFSDVRRPPSDERIERQDIEVVESVGKNIPNPLTAQRIEYFITESVTTTKPGRVLITKSMELTTTCTPTSGVIYFLLVDNVPIRSSAVFSRTGFTGQLSGVTTNVVEAGTHTVNVGLMCTVPGAYPSGATVTVIGITSAIVLP